MQTDHATPSVAIGAHLMLECMRSDLKIDILVDMRRGVAKSKRRSRQVAVEGHSPSPKIDFTFEIVCFAYLCTCIKEQGNSNTSTDFIFDIYM